MKLNITTAVILLLLSISFTAKAAESSSNKYNDLVKYYPMKRGDKWIYAMGGKDTPDEVITITDCNDKEEEGCLFQHTYMNSVKLHDAWQYIGNTVSQTLTSNFMTGEISNLMPPVILLKSPLKVGTSWQNKSDDNIDKLKILKVMSKYKVMAGEFSDVIVVESKQYVKGKETLRIYRYYAPNVGEIKREGMTIKKGKANSKIFISSELIEYKPSGF